jgi:alkylhydroperoxidase family enzyme
MTSDESRIPPIPPDRWSHAQREAFAAFTGSLTDQPGDSSNAAMTLVQHPALAKAFFGLGRHLLFESTLPDRIRELVTLRVTANRRGGEYEHHHHVAFARRIGLSDAEIAAAGQPLAGAPFTGLDLCALRAVDELCADRGITDATWAELSRDLDRRQIMDLVFTVGLYVMASFGNAALGIQVEDEARGSA